MMAVSTLVERAQAECVSMPGWQLRGDVGVGVDDVTNVSTEVRAGSMFCCVRGERHDGHDFADEAVGRGATALLVDHPLEDMGVPQVVVERSQVRQAMGCLAATVHHHPSRHMTVIGITGTNGKTTTAHMLGSILRSAGRRTTVLGTLSGARTTPESPELQRVLAAELGGGTQAVVMEVSSHALALQRVAGMHFAAGVFTNLGHDHLDFHRTEEEYFAAKARLFSRTYIERAVINVDDPNGRAIAASTDVVVTAYSQGDAHDVHVDAAASSFEWRGMRLRCAIGGAFNVMNALAAATTAREVGVEMQHVADGLASLAPIPGRFERVAHAGDFAVIVDYAHTPEALTTLIDAARGVAGRPGARVILVFGCGGDRDAAKRPAMGAAAVGADHVVVTSDNPRYEDPQSIVDAIVAGVPAERRRRVSIEIDRRRAIENAIRLATTDDVVVIAGRGHESTQSVRGEEVAFRDTDVARELLGVAS